MPNVIMMGVLMLNAIMLNVIMMGVHTLNAIMLSVVAPTLIIGRHDTKQNDTQQCNNSA